jgi:putative ABC transport system permease protein
MSRGQLVQSFLYEGAIYALIAAAIGTLLGVAVGSLMILAFSSIFSDPEARLEAAVRPGSMTFAFALGVALTLGTVVLASWRVSRLNIVRAVRDIPDPPPERGSAVMVAAGAVLLVVGALLTVVAVSQRVSMLVMIGPSLVVLGAAILAAQRLGYRGPFTLSGAFIIFWIVGPLGTGVIDAVGARGEAIEMFAAAGMLLVTGGILIIVANSDVIIGLLNRAFSRRPGLVAPARIAISYPMAYRIRTGNTLAMFSLIIFTVVVISMVQTFDQQLVRGSLDQQSGGYGLIVHTDTDHPIPDLESRLSTDPALEAARPQRLAEVRSAGVEVVQSSGRSTFYSLRGVDARFAEENLYTFKAIAPEFRDPREVWRAMRSDPTLAVVDGSVQPEVTAPDFGGFRVAVGERVTIRTPLGESLTLRIAGIMDQLLLFGLFVGDDLLEGSFGAASPDTYLLKVAEHREREAKRALEDEFALKGMSVRVVEEEIEDFIRINDNILTLVKGFMGIGLVVGIAGLGIVTVRAVAERRQETGTLKALGFRDRMVFGAFLMEVSFVALLGIFLGVALGLGLSWKIFEYYFTDLAEFVVPWTVIALICGVAYAATVLCTVSPSLRASRMAPAEAVRYIE